MLVPPGHIRPQRNQTLPSDVLPNWVLLTQTQGQSRQHSGLLSGLILPTMFSLARTVVWRAAQIPAQIGSSLILLQATVGQTVSGMSWCRPDPQQAKASSMFVVTTDI